MYRSLMLAACLVAPVFCGSIEGTVTNSVTGEPVSGVEVRFLDRHSIVSQTVTDANGAYRLTGLQDGDYSGKFSRDGFQDVRGLGGSSHVSGDLSTRVDARLNPWGSLRGRVIDEEGKPAAKVRVECGDQGENTDDSGEFVCAGLWAGAYTVVAKPGAATRVEQGVKLGVVPIYFPSTTRKADAVPVKVAWGAEVSGITIRLRSVPVHRVTGVVLDAAGKPVAKATVKLMGQPSSREREGIVSPGVAYSFIGGIQPEVARVETHEDGAFEFAAVELGDWRLDAEAGVDEDMPTAGVAAVTVGDRDVEDVRIPMGGPFAIPVEVSGASRGPSFLIFLRPLEGQPHINVDLASSNDNIAGLFRGRYGVVDVPPVGGAYVAAVRWEGRNVLGEAVELEPGAAPLQVEIRHDTGSLQGTVENGDGSSVVLVRRETGEVLHYRVEPCGSGGAFHFANVVPGDYYAVALDSVPRQGLPAANLMETIAPLATAVRVEANSAATVNLRVQRWPD